jgi:hypothetical protein
MDNADTELERSDESIRYTFENRLPNSSFNNSSFTQNF